MLFGEFVNYRVDVLWNNSYIICFIEIRVDRKRCCYRIEFFSINEDVGIIEY